MIKPFRLQAARLWASSPPLGRRCLPIRTFTSTQRVLASPSPKDSAASSQDTSISEHALHFPTSKTSELSAASTSTPFQSAPSSPPADWEDNPNYDISQFSQLPHSNFGVNQHIVINDEFKEALRQILWQFRAPIRYAFAYGSGVFPQSKEVAATPSSATSIHSKPPPAVVQAQGGTPKMIDFIFGVSYTQHWHSLNLQQHRDHYSALGSLGSGAVSAVQDKWGAGVYFNPSRFSEMIHESVSQTKSTFYQLCERLFCSCLQNSLSKNYTAPSQTLATWAIPEWHCPQKIHLKSPIS